MLSGENLNVSANMLLFQYCVPGGWAVLVYVNGEWQWCVYEAVVCYWVPEYTKHCAHWNSLTSEESLWGHGGQCEHS
jgi:hypothetical protein